MNIRQETIDKVVALGTTIKRNQGDKFFSVLDTCVLLKLHKSVPKIMIDLGYLTRIDRGVYYPNYDIFEPIMARRVVTKVNEYVGNCKKETRPPIQPGNKDKITTSIESFDPFISISDESLLQELKKRGYTGNLQKTSKFTI